MSDFVFHFVNHGEPILVGCTELDFGRQFYELQSFQLANISWFDYLLCHYSLKHRKLFLYKDTLDQIAVHDLNLRNTVNVALHEYVFDHHIELVISDHFKPKAVIL